MKRVPLPSTHPFFLPISIIVSTITSEMVKPILINANNPEYYAELFCKTSRLAERRQSD